MLDFGDLLASVCNVETQHFGMDAWKRLLEAVSASLHDEPSLLNCEQIRTRIIRLFVSRITGGMAEWFKAHAWKACWG